MNFKAYDILACLVPGFLILLVLFNVSDRHYDKDLVIPYTAIAFLFGFVMNTVSSWMEGIYFFTWGGKPSNRLLDGKDIWKVKFYQSTKVKALLMADSLNPNAKNDELFSIAMKIANGQKDTRVDDFNGSYAFTRSLLTTVILGSAFLLREHYDNSDYYLVLIPVVVVIWLRCKQKAYYYVREVLNVYLKTKNA